MILRIILLILIILALALIIAFSFYIFRRHRSSSVECGDMDLNPLNFG